MKIFTDEYLALLEKLEQEGMRVNVHVFAHKAAGKEEAASVIEKLGGQNIRTVDNEYFSGEVTNYPVQEFGVTVFWTSELERKKLLK